MLNVEYVRPPDIQRTHKTVVSFVYINNANGAFQIN